jgi:conjugal transfer pilus assembly protein TraI
LLRSEPGFKADAAAASRAASALAAASADELLTAHAELLSRIKLCYGVDRATFGADLLPPIRNWAAFVNRLPATADNYFRDAGGLFRLGLEVGFIALQGTDGHIVSGRSTISTRRQLEPRWRQATFLAGLCGELHRTLSHLVVTDTAGEEWPAYLEPLTGWLHERGSQSFVVRWLPEAQESRALGLFALRHIVPGETLQYLATANRIVVPQLLASVAGTPLPGEPSTLAELVKRATALVIDRDLIANAHRDGRPARGAHVQRYLLDAMQRLVASHPAWAPNRERSRVWHGLDGLFVVWPQAAADIRKRLDEDDLPGIPRDPAAILGALVDARIVQACSEAQPLWTIRPASDKAALEAVKLCTPEMLLPADADDASTLPFALAVSPGPAPLHRAPGPTDPRQAVADVVSTVTPQAASAARSDPVTAEGEMRTARGAVDPAAPPASCLQAAAPPGFRLHAPMRLNPRVREALAAAIDTMNGEAKSALAVPVATGIFVALEHFKQPHLDVPTVLRSLAEAGLAVSHDPRCADTVEHEIGGRSVPGIVVRPAFVRGLDPAAFAP